jgi:hypothetical protein
VASKKGNENLFFENLRLKTEKKTVEDKLESQKADYEKKLAERDEKLTGLQAVNTFDMEIGKREKLQPEHKAYILKNRDKLTVKPGEDIPAVVNHFFDDRIKEFDDLKPLFTPGKKEDEKKKEETNEKPGGWDNPHIPD